MCGIMGYTGSKRAAAVLLDGLARLEYRGYDSAGVALVEDGTLFVRKRAGRVSELAESLAAEGFAADMGIGHTRWATHGRPTERNAHPHTDGTGSIAVVHNGIIENHEELRAKLEAVGCRFVSDTDTEVIPHLIAENLHLGIEDAVRAACSALEGAYAIAVVYEAAPDRMIAVRKGSPLVIGLGEGEQFLASSVDALLPFTRRVVYLEDGEWAVLTRDSVEIFDRDGNPVEPDVKTLDAAAADVELGPYPHYMLKEIHEQPGVMRRMSAERIRDGRPVFDEMTLPNSELAAVERVVVQACGTSWHAGLVGRYYLERLAGVHTDVEISSEFRYCDPVLDHKTLVLSISQSGETADVLEGVRLAKGRALRTLSIVNVERSSIARESHQALYMGAGVEIGVASTKAFTAEVGMLFLLALHLGRIRWRLRPEFVAEQLDAFRMLPTAMERLLSSPDDADRIAARIKDARSMFFIGRGPSYPIALEGALKMKEISYIHAAGYPAGELKHGPLALIEDGTPVVVVCPRDGVTAKTVSNAQEARSRGAFVIGVVQEGDEEAASVFDEVLAVPAAPEMLSPLLTVIPLQLLAYRTAVLRGCNVDKPRNLAKSVTVE